MFKQLIKQTPFGMSLIMLILAVGLIAFMAPIAGNKSLIVQSGSMEPTIRVGDLILDRPQSNYKVGEIVTFKDPVKPSITITHRVVGKELKNGALFYKTKGDANREADLNLVPAQNIIGRSDYKIEGVGKILAFAKTKNGFLTFAAIPATLVIFLEISNIFKEVNKSKKRNAKVIYRKALKTLYQHYGKPMGVPHSSASYQSLINLTSQKWKGTSQRIKRHLVIGQQGVSLRTLVPLLAIMLVTGNTNALFSSADNSNTNLFQSAQNFGNNNGCPVCEETTVVVDQNVTIDFNSATPSYSGDADLQPYFTYDKSGPTADTWKAIFNLGGKKLLIKNGATITTTNVPNSGSNRAAPGIQIFACELEVENGGKVSVVSQNLQAGDIFIKIDNKITINGEIRNEVSGTNGLPGMITIASVCGNITTGSSSLIIDEGIDPGGNVINILDCCQGDITINGLVMARAHAHSGDLTQNRPTVRVAALKGAVTINANTTEPILDESNYSGSPYDLWGGLLSWVRDNANPGRVEVQAQKDITVNGHGVDPTAPVRESFGAIAAMATASSSPGGLVDVRSIDGKITANDRAFDVSGRNRLSTNFAHIKLWAKSDISISRPGADNNFNPVVDASSPNIGDNGGANEVRSFSGAVTINTNALVSAHVPPGSGTTQGTNSFTTPSGTITNNGTVDPAAVVATNNSPASPDLLFGNCADFNVTCFCETPQASAVVINEINWEGSSSNAADEWVELRNTTSSPIDLTNWKIDNLGDSANPTFVIASGAIPANGFFLIANYAKSSASSRLNVDPDVVSTGVDLLNTGEQLVLKNNLNAIKDTANVSPSWFAGVNGSPNKSMERKSTPGNGAQSANWGNATTQANFDAGTTDLGTPKAPNGI